MQPSTAMMPYQITDEDEETALLLGTTILPPTTMDDRSSTWTMVAIVAGMTILVAGAVLLRDGGITTAAEGLVVATQGNAPCLPTGGTFSGVSETSAGSESYAFETCYQNGDEANYCWTKSYRYSDDDDNQEKGPGHIGFSPCAPKGDAWHAIDAKYVNTPGVDPKTNPKRCGAPCQGQKHMGGTSF